MADRLIARGAVEAITGLSCTTIYRQMRAGAFPCPIRISKRAVRWRESEVADYIANRPRATGEAA